MSALVIMVEWLNVWWSKSMSMKQTRFTKITVRLKLYFIFSYNDASLSKLVCQTLVVCF